MESLKKRIKEEVEDVEPQAFNDMTIYQDASIRLFDGFVEARRQSAKKLLDAADSKNNTRIMLWSCKVAAHLISDIPEKQVEILRMSARNHPPPCLSSFLSLSLYVLRT